MKGGAGGDPDFENSHGAAPFECYLWIEVEDVAWGATQRELALWSGMAALELGKTKPTGEAETHARRPTGEGYGTVHGSAELDAEAPHEFAPVLGLRVPALVFLRAPTEFHPLDSGQPVHRQLCDDVLQSVERVHERLKRQAVGVER